MLKIARRFVSAILLDGGEGYSSAHVHVIMCNPLPLEEFASRMFILGIGTLKFLATSSTTMESLPLKVYWILDSRGLLDLVQE